MSNEGGMVRRALAEPSAFAPLYDRYFPKIYGYVLYQVQDPQVADDVAAEVFERALARLEQYRPEQGAFSTWLFAIARNRLKKRWRRRQVRRLVSLEALRDRPAATPAPEEIAADNQQLAQLLPLIADLDGREQHILALKFGGGLGNGEIAELTGLTANHVGVILYRTLRQLRRAVAAEEV